MSINRRNTTAKIAIGIEVVYKRKSYDGSLLAAYLGKDPSDVPEGTSLYDYANQLGQETTNVMLTPKLGEENTYIIAVNKEPVSYTHLVSLTMTRPLRSLKSTGLKLTGLPYILRKN